MGESKTNAISAKAKIHVTTMPNATVTFTHGSSTVSKTASSSGICDLDVKAADFGAWSISAASGSASGSNSVTVSAPTQYNVTVTLVLWIIKNGDVVNGFWQNGVGSHHYYEDAGEYIRMYTDQGGSTEQDSWYYNPTVSFGYWKTLVVDTQSVGDPAYAGVSTDNTSNPPSFSASVQLNNTTEEWVSRHTSSVNVASVTGSKYIAFKAKAWINTSSIPIHGAGGQIRIWNAYLSG